jgi:hypothetical protein
MGRAITRREKTSAWRITSDLDKIGTNRSANGLVIIDSSIFTS